MTLRFKYKKSCELKYIAHLDTLRVFTRAIRRAKLPVSYSQGFNPHALISFVMPLSLGFTSNCEFVDIGFEEINEDIKQRLSEALPYGFDITECYAPQNKPSDITACLYSITFEEGIETEKIETFFNQKEFITEKKSKRGIKQVDIMPMIFEHNIEGNTLFAKLSAGCESTLNPELLVKCLDTHKDYQICREEIFSGNQIFR